MPSFDIMSEVDKHEVKNAMEQVNKEVTNRFDFKGSDARVEIKDKEKELVVYADDDFKLSQVMDVLTGRLAKRGIDVRCLELEKIETIGGNKVKRIVKVREGVDQELGKKIIKLLKDSKMKVQGSIQGDVVRVTGAKKDLLQDAIALIRKSINEFPLQFKNFRD